MSDFETLKTIAIKRIEEAYEMAVEQGIIEQYPLIRFYYAFLSLGLEDNETNFAYLDLIEDYATDLIHEMMEI